MKFLCENCMCELPEEAAFCHACGSELLDAVQLEIKDIRPDGSTVRVLTNTRTYGYDITKPLDGMVESWKGLTAKEVAEKAKAWLNKSNSPGAVIQGFKKSYELAFGSKKDGN